MDQSDSQNKQLDYDQFEIFPWNKNFETGHPEIDSQHKELVNLLNKLARTLVNDQVLEIETAFEALADYSKYHFSSEEVIWAKYFTGDSWLEKHKLDHSSFLPQVLEFRNQESDKSLSDIVEDVIRFLFRWLALHIIDNDKRMSLTTVNIEKGYSIDEAKKITEERMSGSMKTLIETILYMYEGLSSSAIDLIRERQARIRAEKKLVETNKELEKLATTDQLTQLYNRRQFNEVFPREIRKAFREEKSLTYIQLDIDYFKQYNDTFGHLSGDKVLEEIGKFLNSVCRRPDDYAFRLGGEEFGILFYPLEKDNALKFCEIIRSGIEELKIDHPKSKVSPYLTVSLGVVSLVPSKGDTMEDLIYAADIRLYRAKEKGRNRIQN